MVVGICADAGCSLNRDANTTAGMSRTVFQLPLAGAQLGADEACRSYPSPFAFRPNSQPKNLVCTASCKYLQVIGSSRTCCKLSYERGCQEKNLPVLPFQGKLLACIQPDVDCSGTVCCLGQLER
jgi:hypothetical protein